MLCRSFSPEDPLRCCSTGTSALRFIRLKIWLESRDGKHGVLCEASQTKYLCAMSGGRANDIAVVCEHDHLHRHCASRSPPTPRCREPCNIDFYRHMKAHRLPTRRAVLVLQPCNTISAATDPTCTLWTTSIRLLNVASCVRSLGTTWKHYEIARRFHPKIARTRVPPSHMDREHFQGDLCSSKSPKS